MRNKKTSHHHGNLRAALVEAGVELIRDHGPDALSIRKVAIRAGVSHAAPAHHFPTLAHLRTAIAAHGHALFARMMRAEMDAEPDKSPRSILLAAGRGYIRFATENAALYHLMFGGSPKIHEDAEFQESAEKSAAVLGEITAPIKEGPAGHMGNQLLVWSFMHGFSGIVLNDYTAKIDKKTAPQLLESIFPDLPMKD